MNEAETRAEHIDPALKAAGWGVAEGSKILREYPITKGRIEGIGRRGKPLTADYVLVYRNFKLAVIEAKAWDEELTEGVAQAKNYAGKMSVRFAFSTNGRGIYRVDMENGREGEIPLYPTPAELWSLIFAKANFWRDRFAAVPYDDKGGSHKAYYFQETAIERVLQAVADGKQRILLTMATGTGKTFVAFQIAWKLFHSRWNLNHEPSRRPRILFLADRNILANQAFNVFSSFPEDALVRIAPDDIRKKGKVPKNGSLFFTIFQTFMSGPPVEKQTPVRPELVEGQTFVHPELVEGSLGERRSPVHPELVEGSLVEGSLGERRSPVHPELVEGSLVEGSLAEGRSPVHPELVEGPSSAHPELVEGSTIEGNELRPTQSERNFYFGEYPPDFFDFIVVDECHRGGANDESTWRGILEYFAPAVQLGMTATPKRDENVDTYAYFSEPVYIYSLKDGINDGFLTPFKVKQFSTTLDDYVYTPDDKLIEGEIEAGKVYTEPDFNRIIEIKEREALRVKLFMEQINQNEKTVVFCATQDHALAVRDLINQIKTSKDPNYCQRVTANDGKLGEQYLREFQDNEKTIPTILTTSYKLSTGVDARNIRNIVLMRPINNIIEFKQIIGRGTRLFDGKYYFTIYDFVKAYHHFSDPEWDGEPIEPEAVTKPGKSVEKPPIIIKEPPAEPPIKQRIKVKLADGKERTIQHTMVTSFWHPAGTPVTAQQFMELLFGKLPEFFKNEAELRAIWSMPDTRKKLLQGLAEKGFGSEQLAEMQRIIDAEKSDLFDVLANVAYALPPITREERAANAKISIHRLFNSKQQVFLDFVLSHYVNVGVEELDQEKLKPLLLLKYRDSIADAIATLGSPEDIAQVFTGFQKFLYQPVPLKRD